MESLESLLRDEFREAPVFDSVPIADLLKTADAGRRRRVALHGVVGVAVAALLIGVGVVLANRPRSIGPPISHSVFHSPQDALENAYGLPVEGTFLDLRQGWVTIERCWQVDIPSPDNPTERCTDYLEVTSDGGSTFTEHALPTPLGPDFYHLYVFDATHLVIAGSLGGSYSSEAPFPSHVPGMVDRARYVSSDGGATWSRVSLAPGAPLDAIPPGGQIVVFGTGGQPTMVLTPDGVAHPLTTAAAFSTTEGADRRIPVAPIAGAYYVYDAHVLDTVGRMGFYSYGKPWVSHDMGRTWEPVAVPPNGHQFTVIGSDDHWTYAWGASTQITDDPHYFASLNGIDWREIPRPQLGDFYYFPSFVTLATGFFIYNENDTWRTRGTAPFTHVRDTTRTRSVVGCGPVAVGLRITPGGAITIATTTDGLHWTDGTIH